MITDDWTILCLLVFFMFPFTLEESVPFDRNCFLYGREVNFTNHNDDKSVEDLRIVLDTKSLIQLGKMKPDCSDLAFREPGNSGYTRHWIESGCNTETTVIWFGEKINPGDTEKFWIYYGCENLDDVSMSTRQSNFKDEFLIFSSLPCSGNWKQNSKYFNKFPFIVSSKSMTVEDGLNHSHTIAGFSHSANVETTDTGRFPPLCWYGHPYSHMHLFIVETYGHHALPPYMDVFLCEQDEMDVFFDGAVILWDSNKSPPPNFALIEEFQEFDGLFPRVAESTYGKRGGNPTHRHYLSSFSQGGSEGREKTCSGNDVHSNPPTHVHKVQGYTSPASNIPSYYTFQFLNYTKPTPDFREFVKDEMIFMATGVPKYGYEKIAVLDGRFIRANSTAGQTGSHSGVHVHSPGPTDDLNFLPSSNNDSCVYGMSNGIVRETHIHGVDIYGCGDSETHLPFFDVVLLRQYSQENISYSLGEEVEAVFSCSPPCKNEGNCTGPNSCTCLPDWGDPTCEIPLCHTTCVFGNCSNSTPGVCDCFSGYEGPLCDIPQCDTPCDLINKGICDAPNHCTCQEGYRLPFCDAPACNNPCVNGNCSDVNTCTCEEGYTGQTCSEAICQPKCYMGQCTSPAVCTCYLDWFGTWCSLPICSPDCENGECVLPDQCRCTTGWSGDRCETPECNPDCVNGLCVAPATCECFEGYELPLCVTPLCEPACVNGNCSDPNDCKCEVGWKGDACEKGVCEVCKHGICISPGECVCNEGYTGDGCEEKVESAGNVGVIVGTLVPLFLLLLCGICVIGVVVAIVIVVVVARKKGKDAKLNALEHMVVDTVHAEFELDEKLKNFEEEKRKYEQNIESDEKEKTELKSQLEMLKRGVDENTNKRPLILTSFQNIEIVGKELLPKKRNEYALHRGVWKVGDQTTANQKFDKTTVLVRKFNAKFFNKNPQIDTYEHLKLVISSYMNFSHPNIMKYLTMSDSGKLSNTYVVAQDLEYTNFREFILRETATKTLSFSDIIKIVYQITMALNYLNVRGYSHERLNEKTIYFTKEMNPVIDFGFQNFLCEEVGAFTAPEVLHRLQGELDRPIVGEGDDVAVSGELQDDEDVDPLDRNEFKRGIYSLGIVMYVLIDRDFDVYKLGKRAQNEKEVAKIVANDPNLQCVLKKESSFYPNWYVNMMKMCLERNPEDRPTSERIMTIIQSILE